MALIEQMLSVQPGLITQVTGSLTHTRFWAATVFVGHYSDYCYSHLMRGTSAEENLQSKESHKRLISTHGYRVFSYRSDNGIFEYPLIKEAVQICRQQISYCGAGYHH